MVTAAKLLCVYPLQDFASLITPLTPFPLRMDSGFAGEAGKQRTTWMYGIKLEVDSFRSFGRREEEKEGPSQFRRWALERGIERERLWRTRSFSGIADERKQKGEKGVQHSPMREVIAVEREGRSFCCFCVPFKGG